MYDLIKQGKYKSFVKALNNGKRYADDIFNFFRKNVLRFDDVVAKGAKSIDDIKLSTGGMKIKTAGSHGSDTASMVISFENFHKRGAQLLKTEGEIAWKHLPDHAKPIDHLSVIGGEKVGVSVTRAFEYQGEFTLERAKKLLNGKFEGLKSGIPNLANPAEDMWDVGVVHVIAPSEGNAQLVKEAFNGIDKSIIGNNKIIITVTENLDYIYGGG